MSAPLLHSPRLYGPASSSLWGSWLVPSAPPSTTDRMCHPHPMGEPIPAPAKTQEPTQEAGGWRPLRANAKLA